MKNLSLLTFALLLLVAACKKDSPQPVAITKAKTDSIINLNLNLSVVSNYPSKFLYTGIHIHKDQCRIWGNMDTTYSVNDTIRFVTADSIQLSSFSRGYQLDANNHCHHTIHHFSEDLQLNGDSIYYTCAQGHCSLGYACDVWFVYDTITCKIQR